MDSEGTIKQHVANPQVPQGYTLASWPTKCGHADKGILTKGKDKSGKDQLYFFCQSHEQCRQDNIKDPAGARILLAYSQSDNRYKPHKISGHYKNKHGEVTEAAAGRAASQQRLKSLQQAAEKVRGTKKGRRRMMLETVLTWQVARAMPFNMWEGPEVFDWKGSYVMGAEQLTLNSKNVKHIIGELYAHVMERAKEKINPILEFSKRVGLPMLGVNPDFVKIKVKGLKILSVRLQGVDEELKIVSTLVGLREYKPSDDMQKQERAGGRTGYFLQTQLEDLGVQIKDLSGGCSDSGPDIRYCVDTWIKTFQPHAMREWCVRACIDWLIGMGWVIDAYRFED